MTLWVRFLRGERAEFGTVEDGQVSVHVGEMLAVARPTGETLPAEGLHLLAPVTPGKFIGLWNNFFALAEKQGNAIPDVPLYFLKATSSIIGHETGFRAPASYTGRVVYEGELGIVIGQPCTNVDEATAAAHIFGYTCVNDITAAELFGDPVFPQWARAKSCDGFGPIGPAIATGLDPAGLVVRTLLNGRERQAYPVADMIFPPARIVSLISREMTLHPGDLITCGTSLGVLPMRPGMVVEVAIEGIGTLRNTYLPAG
jgi:2-keto-4-pentenoate hydratase/2-oxohepta-3-ene-1,7-dioic acid hydratase in catechol pathway